MERAVDNPWPQWPRVLVWIMANAGEPVVFGKDPRVFDPTKEFIGDEHGN
jgi:hypothetical protein